MSYNWTARALPSAAAWEHVAYGGSTFVALVSGSSNVAATSPDGITWTARTRAQTRTLNGIAYGGGVFCAIGSGSLNACETTPDGITWTTRPLGGIRAYQAIAYGAGTFCAIANLTNIAATSTDAGVTFVERTLPSSGDWYDIAWDGTVFCAVKRNSADAATSPDGITWTARTLPASRQWRSIESDGAGTLVALAYSSAVCAVSTDHGVSWTEYAMPSSNFWWGITWTGSKFVAVTYFDDEYAESVDGTSWIGGALPSSTGWHGIASDGANLIVAVSNDTSTAALQGVDGTINEDLTGAVVGTATGAGAVRPTLAATMVAGDTAAGDVLANLIASLEATGSVQAAATLAGVATQSVTFLDTVTAAWQLLLEADVATAGTAVPRVQVIAALADALAATGVADSALTAFAACTSAIALEGLLAQGFSAEVVEQTLLADTATALAKLLGPLVDGLLVTGAGEVALRLSAVSAESVALASPAEALMRANADLADGLLLYVTVRIGSTDYVGWVLNTDLKAASEHRNAPFDSFAAFKGKHYAAGPDGIFRFTGTTGADTDAGTPIEAWIKSFLIDFGTDRFKRNPDAFVGVTAAGDLVLKVITRTPGTGVKTEDWYRVERLPAQGPGTGIVGIGRGLKSTWWQYVLHNVDGGALGLDHLALRPIILDRRT